MMQHDTVKAARGFWQCLLQHPRTIRMRESIRDIRIDANGRKSRILKIDDERSRSAANFERPYAVSCDACLDEAKTISGRLAAASARCARANP